MPRQVDPELRRAVIAEAVWRVVRRDGLEKASVRNVAREAGLSPGSLRHYFASQSELMVFALRVVVDRIEARIRAIGADAGPRERAERVLDQLLPLDPERRAENEVWLAFTARALVDAGLRGVQDEVHESLRSGCRALVRALAGDPGLDVELEAERLHALVDGVAVHAAMRPADADPARMRALLARHLDGLAAPAPRRTNAPASTRR